MKKAIVSTLIGAEGIDGVNGEDFILSDSPNDFSNTVVKCLLDDSLREKLSANAFRFVKDKYDWGVLAEIQKEVWLQVGS